MKSTLLRLADYHLWATRRIVDAIAQLPEEQYRAPVPSSFPGLLPTLLHMWDAEAVWWHRVNHLEGFSAPGKDFQGGWREASDGLLEQSAIWTTFLHSRTEDDLASGIAYKNLKGEPFLSPLGEIILHLFNHGTYHRGQLVTMMRALGTTGAPATDYIVWSRS